MLGRVAVPMLVIALLCGSVRADVLVNDRSGDPGAVQAVPRVTPVINLNTNGEMVVVVWENLSTPATQSRARYAVSNLPSLSFVNGGAPPAPTGWVWNLDEVVHSEPLYNGNGVIYLAGGVRQTSPAQTGVGFVRATVDGPGSVTFDTPLLLANFGTATTGVSYYGIIDMQVHPADGTLFVLYAPYSLTTDLRNVYFIRSVDGGFNWSSPTIVSSDSTLRPISASILCGETAGDVTFLWQQYDATGLYVNVMARHSSDHGTTLGAPKQVMTFPNVSQNSPARFSGYMPVVEMDRSGNEFDGTAIYGAPIPFDLAQDVFPSVASATSISEIEPNGSTATATLVSPVGAVVRGQIAAPPDTDFFAFDLAQGQEVNALGDSIPAFDGTTTFLIIGWLGSDGHSVLTSGFNPATGPMRIGFVAPTTARYTMRVTGTVAGAYRLRTVQGSAPSPGASDQRDIAISFMPPGGSWTGTQRIQAPDAIGCEATGLAITSAIDGGVYLSYNDFDAVPGSAVARRVLRRSNDGGSTWSAPATISSANSDWGAATGSDYWRGDMACGDGIRIFTTWTDARNGDPDIYADFTDRRIYVTSTDAFEVTVSPGAVVHAVRNVQNADLHEAFNVRMAPDGSGAGWTLPVTTATLAPGATSPLDCRFTVPPSASLGDVSVPIYYQPADRASPINFGLATLTVHVVSGGVGVGPVGAAVLALSPIEPNPAVDACRIRYSLARAGRVRIAVYGLDGRLERTLVDGDRPGGAQEATWDGTDARGAHVAPGEYFVVLKTDGKTLTRRMIVLR